MAFLCSSDQRRKSVNLLRFLVGTSRQQTLDTLVAPLLRSNDQRREVARLFSFLVGTDVIR
jgi:hypothetical protein